jgi:hypothetical protein
LSWILSVLLIQKKLGRVQPFHACLTIHRCSEAKSYSVGFRVPPGGHEIGWRALIYERKDKTSGVVGYEYDPGSGSGSEVYWVDDSAVDQAAREGGTLSDFAKYQKKGKMNISRAN